MNGKVQQSGGEVRVDYDVKECEETDRAVRALPFAEHEAIMEYWTKGGTIEQKAKAIGCSQKTIYNRLDRAYAKLLGLMNDIAAGLDPRD